MGQRRRDMELTPHGFFIAKGEGRNGSTAGENVIVKGGDAVVPCDCTQIFTVGKNIILN